MPEYKRLSWRQLQRTRLDPPRIIEFAALFLTYPLRREVRKGVVKTHPALPSLGVRRTFFGDGTKFVFAVPLGYSVKKSESFACRQLCVLGGEEGRGD